MSDRPALKKPQQGSYDRITAALLHPMVEQGKRRGFGFATLQVRGKIFALLSSHGSFVVKLSRVRVVEAIVSHAGEAFELVPGRAMKEWLVVTEPRHWLSLAEEARDHALQGRREAPHPKKAVRKKQARAK